MVDATNWRYDINGDGKINGVDQNASRSRSGVLLANFPEPIAPPAGAVVPGVAGGTPAAASLSGLPAPDAGPAIVSSVPDSPAAAASPVAAARGDGSVGSAASSPADGWATEQLVLREAALVEDADTAALAGGSQTAARDAWFAEFGGRPAPLGGDAVGLDAGPSPAARSPVMAGEAGTDAGATFYRQLALRPTLRPRSDPTEDETDLAMLASTGVRRLISAFPIRDIESIVSSGSHSSSAGEDRKISETD